MFKNMLPQEAQILRRSPSKMDAHFQRSAFAPLAVALHTGVVRLKASITRFKHNRIA